MAPRGMEWPLIARDDDGRPPSKEEPNLTTWEAVADALEGGAAGAAAPAICPGGGVHDDCFVTGL